MIDIGAGSGKLALAVAASTPARVLGIEYGERYVAAARASAGYFGLSNAEFLHADARDADLSRGSVFNVYHPPHGEVARTLSTKLGKIAQLRDVRLYVAGPRYDFADSFLAEVKRGALRLIEQRGAFGEVLVLRSG